MRLLWQNLVDGATLTTSSQLATLPGTNVQQPHLSRKWNTAAGVKSAYQVYDLGASRSCAQLAVLGTNLSGAATVQLRASDLDPNALANLLYDSGVVAAGVKAGYGALYKAFNALAARYWRLNLTDNSLPDNLQVGRVVLGPSWTVTDKMLWGWGVTPLDPSTVARSRGGQSYPDPLPQVRVLEFTLDYMSEAQAYDNVFAAARANGVVKDVLAMPFENGAYLSEQTVWGQVRASEPLIHRATRTFRQKFRIEERL